jgi:hypothetical protein
MSTGLSLTSSWRLIDLHVSYTDDLGVGTKVGMALATVGEFAAGPVSRAVAGAPRPEQRMALLYVLQEIYRGRDLSIGDRMLQIFRRDPDDRVRQLAASVITRPALRGLGAGTSKAAAEARRSEGHQPGRTTPPRV